jgi:transposase
MTTHSLYAWKMRYGPDSAEQQEKTTAEIENKRLRKELKRVTEERDLLKKAAVYFANQPE